MLMKATVSVVLIFLIKIKRFW